MCYFVYFVCKIFPVLLTCCIYWTHSEWCFFVSLLYLHKVIILLFYKNLFQSFIHNFLFYLFLQSRRDSGNQEALEKASMIAPLRASIEMARDYYEDNQYQGVIDTLEKPIEVSYLYFDHIINWRIFKKSLPSSSFIRHANLIGSPPIWDSIFWSPNHYQNLPIEVSPCNRHSSQRHKKVSFVLILFEIVIS